MDDGNRITTMKENAKTSWHSQDNNKIKGKGTGRDQCDERADEIGDLGLWIEPMISAGVEGRAV